MRGRPSSLLLFHSGYLFIAWVTSCLYLARVLFTSGVCSTFLYCFRIPGRIRMVGSMSFNFEFGAEHVMNQCSEGLEEGFQQW
jgi:hypothetical protein